MKTHYLKIWTTYYDRVESGVKRFEVRENDRDFQVGDRVVLQAYDFEKKSCCLDKPDITTEITYIIHGGSFGIEPGYCVFGFRLLKLPY